MHLCGGCEAAGCLHNVLKHFDGTCCIQSTPLFAPPHGKFLEFRTSESIPACYPQLVKTQINCFWSQRSIHLTSYITRTARLSQRVRAAGQLDVVHATPKPEQCWLDRFITSQRDHGGYLCTGINNSLSLQESWHLPPSSVTLVGPTLKNLARDDHSSMPSFISSPSLSFYPISHFSHLQADGLLTENEVSSQLSHQHPTSFPSQTPRFQNLFPQGP